MGARVLVGCTGWGYDDWRGGFYPPGTPPAEYLERYARVFRLAEVDSSYYRAPTLSQALRWARDTPPGFTFAPKIPGAITHEARARGVEEPLNAFLRALAPLRDAGKLGPLVAQFPATFRRDTDADALESFLALVPRTVALAVELRHPSWWTRDTYRALEARNAALVWSENQYAETPPERTADFVYARLIGDRALTRFDRVQRDGRPTLRRWALRLHDALPAANAVYVLLNNHFMGFAPATAQLMQEMLGEPVADLALAARSGGQRGLGEFG